MICGIWSRFPGLNIFHSYNSATAFGRGYLHRYSCLLIGVVLLILFDVDILEYPVFNRPFYFSPMSRIINNFSFERENQNSVTSIKEIHS